MNIMDKLKLRHKLLLLISLPLTLVLLFAMDRAHERQLDLRDSNNVLDFAQITDLVKIVHRLQFERGKAAKFTTIRSSESLIEWRSAGELTDRFASELPEVKKQLADKRSAKAAFDAIQSIEANLNTLQLLRSSIKQDKEFNTESARQVYTDIINSIHTSLRMLVKLVPGSTTFQLADSITVISELKEAVGQQRALVSSILSNKKATKEDIRLLSDFHLKEQFLTNNFLELATHQFQEDFLAGGVDQYGKTKADLINKIITQPAGTEIIYDVETWFNEVTSRINELREMEKEITNVLVEFARDGTAQSISSFWFTIITAVLTILAVAIITWFATGKLANGFLKLRDSSLEFTDSGALKKVQVVGYDEVGQVARAYNHLIDQLLTISQAAESVAHGDYAQKIEVKGEHDSLAQSLNHMFNTLRDSVDSLKTENWIKTGQSELANNIGSDQSLHEIAQSAISYLAEYLKAPIAAMYTVDQNGTSDLCASYAYTVRKDNANSFEIGESLVGQAVLEKKPIIIEQLPEGYVSIQSALGSAVPKNIIVYPLIYAQRVLGVLELGTLNPLTPAETDLLQKSASGLAVAMHAASSRDRMSSLLEETQSQAEELQNQQAELEQSNAELEQHSQRLKDQQGRLEKANSELEQQARELEESKEELELQKKQLVQSNEELTQQATELEARNKEVEARSEELEKARYTLELKAEELTAASKYKTEFLANMSHELRTPLNSLLLLAQTLKENDEKNLSAHQIEAIGIIYGSGSDLLNLINDILDLSKVEAGKLTIENDKFEIREVVELLERQFHPLAKDKNINLEVNINEDVPASLFSDSQRLQQILRNLVGNAIKFTEQGGVSLSVTKNVDNDLEFIVKDTGIGVPEQLKAAIFEAFQQGDGSTRRKYSGTGLGLTISRELAHKLGGEILLKSTEGEGSEFTLVLPASIALASENNENPQGKVTNLTFKLNSSTSIPEDKDGTSKELNSNGSSLHTGKVVPISSQNFEMYIDDDRNNLDSDLDLLLIIEDDKNFAKCIRDLARKRSMQCVVSKNVKTGVEMAKHFSPSSIVLDMILPDGTGNDVIETLKQHNHTKDIPIHIVSSFNRDELKVDKSIDVIEKPISKDAIDEALKKIFKALHPDQQKKLLVIEDDPNTRKTIEMLLKDTDLKVIHAATGKEGLKKIKEEDPSCMILDLSLPDIESIDILKQVAAPDLPDPMPVIIYTGRDLSHEEYKDLRQYTANIIIKGNLAQERLLNEITLFLHSLKPKTVKPVNGNNSANENILEGKKVLVVDDDMRNTFALASLLRRNGMTVVLADNGSLALEKLSENKDIELAIMDIMMPVMDGYEAIRKIRERNDYKDLPIIALTAKAMPEDRDKCLKVGANDYLAKPVDSERLMSAIRIWGNA